MSKTTIKSEDEIKAMAEGGAMLGTIRDNLMKVVAPGVSAWEVEIEANRLIDETGGKASFKMVPGYSWATCINVNSGVVHGIPKKSKIFQQGDVVSVDVGLFYKNFHTDTSDSTLLGEDRDKQRFLDLGKKALRNAIDEAKPGNRIYDISLAMQRVIEEGGANVILDLTGHGVGHELHEAPFIPCFVFKGSSARDKTPKIKPGMVLAIEVMYTKGEGNLATLEDGWTIVSGDGKISALFEETVAVLKDGPVVLTQAKKHA